jgi:hypothetical protein
MIKWSKVETLPAIVFNFNPGIQIPNFAESQEILLPKLHFHEFVGKSEGIFKINALYLAKTLFNLFNVKENELLMLKKSGIMAVIDQI